MSAVLQTEDRRQQNQRLISALQKGRKDVWSLYFEIGRMKPFSHTTEMQSLVTKFSQLVIDYASLGHFGIYERLLAGSERREGVLTVAKRIYPEFSKITEDVVSFNDKYDGQESNFAVSNLETDLSELGESLAKRIDLEDELCQQLGRFPRI